MSGVIHFPERVDDNRLHDDVAREALRRGLTLVIDRHGNVLLTPQVLPGMQRIYTVDRAAA